MKEIRFDVQGEKIVINVEMQGLYFITYIYQLWASTTSEPPIVSNPIRQGSNESPHDDSYEVKSDYVPNELVHRNDKRVIDVRFWVKRVVDDIGYRLKVTVYQRGMTGVAELGHEEVTGTVNGSIKEEFIAIKLIASN